ncbi:hypothetical protein [Parvibaculum sp.]|uniref:hypothetical protein n=1 Tax=Parvibaculum sp. TaxID=2024848 RepID=UPI000C98F99B|nr:hypothetical protein [Parvibaculum sp.]MAB14468.1 hypothetical protein [Parvibaculum sp.]
MPFSNVLRRTAALAAALSVTLLVAGCSTDDDGYATSGIGSMLGFGGSTQEGGTAAYPCPNVGVLDQADRITAFNGSGQDITDVAVRAELNKVVTQCEYNLSDSTITFDIAFDGVAELGPGATSRTQNLPVFMAVTRRFGKLVKKQTMTLPVTFAPGETKVRFTKMLEGNVVPYGKGADGRIYYILVGFQLSQDQLAYNRRVAPVPIR